MEKYYWGAPTTQLTAQSLRRAEHRPPAAVHARAVRLPRPWPAYSGRQSLIPRTRCVRGPIFFSRTDGSAASALTSPTSARARMPASTRLHVHGTSGWRTDFNIYTGAVHGARDCTTNRRRRVIVVNYRNRAESPSNGRKLQISFGDSCYRSLSLPLLLTQIKHGPTVGRFSRHKRNVDPNKDETKKKAINWRRI